MFGRRRRQKQETEDPAVAEIEQILTDAAPMTSMSDLRGRPVARNALWICPCVTFDASPTWLIYDNADGDLVWLRVPDGIDPLDLVEARSSAGGHSDPAETLDWLRRERSHPWGPVRRGLSDPGVVEALLARINADPH